jgi:hypothetical protein
MSQLYDIELGVLVRSLPDDGHVITTDNEPYPTIVTATWGPTVTDGNGIDHFITRVRLSNDI